MFSFADIYLLVVVVVFVLVNQTDCSVSGIPECHMNFQWCHLWCVTSAGLRTCCCCTCAAPPCLINTIATGQRSRVTFLAEILTLHFILTSSHLSSKSRLRAKNFISIALINVIACSVKGVIYNTVLCIAINA